jgi:hypothetical protein
MKEAQGAVYHVAQIVEAAITMMQGAIPVLDAFRDINMT